MPAQPNQSLIDGLACLQALAAAKEPTGVRPLARELGLEPTRVSRLLGTLASIGLARRSDRGKYTTGPGVHVLAAQALFASDLLRAAIGPLESLHRFGLLVAMGVLWRGRVAYLYHATPGMDAATALGRAGLFPAHRSGIGVALLAPTTDLRTVDADTRNRLRDARDRGYALVPTGYRTHRSLGVALPDDSGTAIALSGRIAPRRVPTLARAVRDAANAIAEHAPASPNTPDPPTERSRS